MAVEKVVNITVKKKGDNVVEDLNKELKTTDESVKNVNSSLDNLTGGAVTKFNTLKGSISTAINGFKSLRVAIIATGLGALVIGIVAVKEAFTASEEGQNKFARLMTQIGVITGNVIDIFANLGESIFNVGKVLIKVAKGDLQGASDAWKDFKENIEDVTNGIKNFGEETEREIKLAGRLADARAKADKIERALITQRAEANRDIAEQREIAARSDLFNIQQRKEALEEANRINEEITNKEIFAAKLRRDAQIEENKLSKSTKEDLEEEERLKARVIELETQRLNLAKRLGTELATLNNQARNQELKEIEDFEKEKLRIETEGAEASRLLEEETDQAEIDAEDRRLQRLFKDVETTKKVEEAKEDIQKSSAKAVFGLLSSLAGENKEIQKGLLIAENATGIAENIINTNAANATLTQQLGVAAPPAIAANFARMGIGIASSIAATAKGLSALGGGSGGSSSTSSTPSAPTPTFNLNEGTQSNQIANAIGTQNDKPIQAVVVSSNVTTAQELDRNIINEGSI